MGSDSQRSYIALERALRAGDLDFVGAIFEDRSSFPNVEDPGTGTALLALAIWWSPLALTRELLTLGADPNYEASDGYPAVYAALDSDRSDRLELVDLLITRGADPNERGLNDYTPLHLAVARRDRPAMELLMALGPDASARTRIDGYATPIEEAELLGNTEGAAMLKQVIAGRDP